MRIHLITIALVATAACGPGRRVEHTTAGDTIVVRTTGRGTWGAPRVAVEEKRAGNGSSVTSFGHVTAALALPDEGALVFDAKGLNGPTLERFDANGAFVAFIGQVGTGPGEFGPAEILSLAAAANGTMLVLDHANGRVNRYAKDGHALTPVPVANVTGNGLPDYLRAADDNSFYVWSYVVRDKQLPFGEQVGYVHYDSTGLPLDTIPPQQLWLPPPPRSRFAPADQWSLLNDGRVLMTRTDLAGVVVKTVRGAKTIVKGELVVAPAPFAAEERKELQAMVNVWDNHIELPGVITEAKSSDSVPATKPQIRSVLTDIDGRIWVQRNVASTKVSPKPAPGAPKVMLSYDQATVWDAFLPDGTFLGEAVFPMNTIVVGFRHDVAWAINRDQRDQQALVKYRIPGIAGK